MNIIDELLDLKKSFEDDKDYKGYMVKQVIDARLKADEQRSDLVVTDLADSEDVNNPPSNSSPTGEGGA